MFLLPSCSSLPVPLPLILTLLLLVLVEWPRPSSSTSIRSAPSGRCSSPCAVVGICTSRVLLCGDNEHRFPVLQPVNCSRFATLALLDSDRPAIVDYVEPTTFGVLLKQGVKSLLIGLAVTNIKRFTFREVVESSGLVVFLNGLFVREIEWFSFEEKKIQINFYNLPTLGYRRFHDYRKADVKKTTYCDSNASPCLCKDFFPLNGSLLGNHSHYYEERSTTVCHGYLQSRTKCRDRRCRLPSRAEFATQLYRASRQPVIPHDYCVNSSPLAYSLPQTSSLLSLWSVAISFTTLISIGV